MMMVFAVAVKKHQIAVKVVDDHSASQPTNSLSQDTAFAKHLAIAGDGLACAISPFCFETKPDTNEITRQKYHTLKFVSALNEKKTKYFKIFNKLSGVFIIFFLFYNFFNWTLDECVPPMPKCVFSINFTHNLIDCRMPSKHKINTLLFTRYLININNNYDYGFMDRLFILLYFSKNLRFFYSVCANCICTT